MSHPRFDCEDCGQLHTPYSAHLRDSQHRQEEVADGLLLSTELTEAIKRYPNLSRETVRDVFDVLIGESYE